MSPKPNGGTAIKRIALAGILVLASLVVLVHRGTAPQVALSSSPPRCSNIQVLIRPVNSSGAAGTIVIAYSVHTLFGGPCHLQGYPGLELLDRDFHSLPTTVQRGGSFPLFDKVPVRDVVLDGQHDAYFALKYNDVPTNNESCPGAPYLMVIPPNDRLPVVTYSSSNGAAIMPCGGRLVVSPVASTSPLR